MKYKIKMFFWRIANKRYMNNKHNKIIDDALCYIVNKLNKE